MIGGEELAFGEILVGGALCSAFGEMKNEPGRLDGVDPGLSCMVAEAERKSVWNNRSQICPQLCTTVARGFN